MNQQINQQSAALTAALNQAKNIAVVINEADFDALAAGLALYLSLREAKKEGGVFLTAPDASGWQSLAGAEFLRTDLGKEHLAITLNYPLEKIEKVFSDDSQGKLRLVVRLKDGAEPIKKEQIVLDLQTPRPDLGFVFGNFDAEAIPASWQADKKNWVLFSHQPDGEVGFSFIDSMSYSEMVAHLLQNLGLPFNAQMAENLYQGIRQATNSFANIRDYRTLETAALCFKILQKPAVKAKSATGLNDLASGASATSQQEQNNVVANAGETDRQEPEAIESKESDNVFRQPKVAFPTPKIFRGATTPKNG